MSRRAVTAVLGGVLVVVGLVALAASGGGGGAGRRRLSEHEALAPENIRKWVGTGNGDVAADPIDGRRSMAHLPVTAYRPAASEAVWLDGARKGKICATAELPDVEEAAKLSTAYSNRAFWATKGEPAPTPTVAERKALSQFHYGRLDGDHYAEPIEPLTGVGRHPFAPAPRGRDDV